jgi:hypothetical protein
VSSIGRVFAKYESKNKKIFVLALNIFLLEKNRDRWIDK